LDQTKKDQSDEKWPGTEEEGIGKKKERNRISGGAIKDCPTSPLPVGMWSCGIQKKVGIVTGGGREGEAGKPQKLKPNKGEPVRCSNKKNNPSGGGKKEKTKVPDFLANRTGRRTPNKNTNLVSTGGECLDGIWGGGQNRTTADGSGLCR